jgi:hypothetical protein
MLNSMILVWCFLLYEFINLYILSSGGQEGAKRALEEAVILPVLRPEVN